jgi:hypothetical protein
MIKAAEKVDITKMHKAILQTVLYFDIFKYPLKENEIVENCNKGFDGAELKRSLNELVTLGYLKQVKEFFMPHWADIDNVERREKGNNSAAHMMKEVQARSKKVARFPFIKGLCISGSLSKNYFDAKSDIDFFVITKANRLWLCRTLFVLYYKLLPERKKKFYCLNYFISEADLRIEDQNIFVATELAYLIPTFNHEVYSQLLEQNSWYKHWFSNKPQDQGKDCINNRSGFLKKLIEAFFAGGVGDWADEYLFKKTARHWWKLYGHVGKDTFEVQFRSRKHVAKRHDKGYQEKVLKALDQKIKDIEDTFQQKLN